MSETVRPDRAPPAPDAESFRCGVCEAEYQGGDACPVCGALRVEVPCDRHGDRVAEGRCVVCGRAVCDECRADQPNTCLCEEHRTISVIEGWAQVYATASEIEGQLLRENLQAEGIDAQLFSQKDRAFSVDLGELSIVRVLVPVWEYAAALQLIRDYTDAGGEVVFACPQCGEAYDPGTPQCTACGAPLG